MVFCGGDFLEYFIWIKTSSLKTNIKTSNQNKIMSNQLDRSILERKTKEELHAMAVAMGGKPGSQDLKAKVVDLILELADSGSGKSEENNGGANEKETESVEREERTKSIDQEPDEESFEDSIAGTNLSPASRNNSQNRRRRGRGDTRKDDRRKDDNYSPADLTEVEGFLDLRDDGYGFLRVNTYVPTRDDVYVSARQIKQFDLRRGDYVKGSAKPPARNEKNSALLKITEMNGKAPDDKKVRPIFEELTPLFPDSQLRLERADDKDNMTTRIIDLISPIGKGQRGLIVSPPKAGKTTIMKEIARSIEVNNPEVELMVLLVDERPEEVTDMRRWLQRGEVMASTFDRPAEEHIHVAEMTMERAKRKVEEGTDVVIILDGITRLARAYNLGAPASGRIMSGGVDSAALYPPKRFFGAARNMEEGGSLTILATALVETGSRMDEVIFEEFKGTGNMELRLDRQIAERRIYPAIDVEASSTRHEELLFGRKQLQQVWKLRRVLSGFGSSDGNGNGNPAAGLELLIDRLKSFPKNESFLEEIAKGA